MSGRTRFYFVISFLFFNTTLLVIPAYAQFWHTLPAIFTSSTAEACFSDDGKKVFYLDLDHGVGNVWSMIIMDKYGGIIAGPKNPPVQITKFSDRGIVRFFHVLNRPEIVFMRAAENGKDFHIYRMKDDGSDQPQDLTPGGDGITNVMIGGSNNGRYIYYSSNAVHHDKMDVYRYDTQQFTSDLIFPNDKDYEVLAWTRDQKKLLIGDSLAHALLYYDIETTDRIPLAMANGKITDVDYEPAGVKEIEFAQSSTISSNDSYRAAKEAIMSVDYSPNGKYKIVHDGAKWMVSDMATNTALPLPEGVRPIVVAPKETLLVYLSDSKLNLYDISKNKSTELTALK